MSFEARAVLAVVLSCIWLVGWGIAALRGLITGRWLAFIAAVGVTAICHLLRLA